MTPIDHSWLALPLILGLLAVGVWLLAMLDSWTLRSPAQAFVAPLQGALRLLLKEFRPTERPDLAIWLAAPLLLLTLVCAALAVLPLAPGLIGADLPVGWCSSPRCSRSSWSPCSPAPGDPTRSIRCTPATGSSA